MSERFVCLRWTPVHQEQGRRARAMSERLLQGEGWNKLVDWRGVLVLHLPHPGSSVSACENKYSVVFGSIFRRASDAVRVHKLSVLESLAAAESGGDTLVKDFWGGYVAIAIEHAHDNVHILRDPTGAQPCWYACKDDVHILFSDLRDYHTIGGALSVDRARVSAFLLQPRLAMSAAGIVGVREFLPGERLSIGRKTHEWSVVWRPPEASGALSFKAAVAAMRDCVDLCVGAWGRDSKRVALRLSGGLDSSLVLACLARTAPETEIVCVNEFSRAAPEGDERDYARAAAEHAGKAFIELEMRPEDVRYENVFSAPIGPTPVRSSLDWANPTFVAAMLELKPDAVLSGQAGDHVFHRSRTPLIAADAVRDPRMMGAWLSIATDTSHASGKSLWTIAKASVWHGIFRRPFDLLGLWRRERQLMNAPDWTSLEDFALHPWLSGWRKLPADRAMRLAFLMDAVHYNDPTLLRTAVPCVAPLFSQPILEVSLGIPPWTMTRDGVDRAVARAAFGAELPVSIVERRTKAETTRYFGRVLQVNRACLADTLLHGQLRSLGLIDAAAVERALNPETSVGATIKEVLNCFVAEAWLQRVDELAKGVASAEAA
ncbi:MAG: asparagine synthase-related protein [Vitreimonas sp.]